MDNTEKVDRISKVIDKLNGINYLVDGFIDGKTSTEYGGHGEIENKNLNDAKNIIYEVINDQIEELNESLEELKKEEEL